MVRFEEFPDEEYGGVHIGHLDGAQHYVDVFAADDRYVCPDCETRPIDPDAYLRGLWSVSSTDELWSLVPEAHLEPGVALARVDRGAERFDLPFRVTFDDGAVRCSACGADYPVRVDG